MIPFYEAQESGIHFLMSVDQPQQISWMPLCKELELVVVHSTAMSGGRKIGYEETHSKNVSERRLNQIPQLVGGERFEYRRDIVRGERCRRCCRVEVFQDGSSRGRRRSGTRSCSRCQGCHWCAYAVRICCIRTVLQFESSETPNGYLAASVHPAKVEAVM